ncbi:polyketide synthase [Sporothrix schenckii 1099-18]|uniref:Polyketide synthase n=1 Tax=Sporothrix schenckii 1099-18 TaxID=1397361 RepID=A0A0F2MGN3_SPOSC|nr:polyketide synthase [Sporothrix schenckii 1099-18]KJR88229.1 polyketide synthase [Sporothrix schenckii 1099-18]
MAPIAITPDPSTASPSGDSDTGYFPRDGRYVNGRPGGTTSGFVNGSGLGLNTDSMNNGAPKIENTQTPIAIIGIACRMPGDVATPAEFWELLSRSRSGFSKVPEKRFNADTFYHPNAGKGGSFSAVGGNFLTCDLESFDAPFFGLTEKEAISMDPQQRLLLECTFEALESAGIPKQNIVGKDVGVFVGGSFPEYESHLFRDSDTIPMHQATGCAYAMQSNRLSHFFDLRGPSFTSDTACSSSMVATHLACQSLRLGESSMAIVGGCHLNMLPEFWISFSTCRLLSDTGRSIAFDERGTGFGRGEGCGLIVLKPLDQALRDNDPVRAVIVGTGLNQDGKTPGITMPSGEAQEALMRQVYRNAGLDPKECGFVEAHGTGTKVGDPIEATALHNVLGLDRTTRDPLYIGSVKSNIGHLEAASGIAGIIKAALMLERGFILPNHDFKVPNPKIPWKEWNMKVPINQRPWPRGKKYISVNNFGFGGTNGHVVLAAAPFKAKPSFEQDLSVAATNLRKLFVFTANDKATLSAVMKNAVIYLEQRPEIFQADLMANFAYTFGQRRSHLQYRAAISASNSFELVETLNGEKYTPGKETEPLRIGFIFTGQGAQWWGMGRELYEQYPVFTSAIDHADRCLAALGAEWSLVEELGRDATTTRVNEAHISQPSCTAVQLALTDLLSSWGIRPEAVAGHSSGEIGAAYAAGIITFETAMAVAYHRGRLIPILKESFPDLKGRMMAVGGSKEEFQPIIDNLKEKEVRIACYNSPSSLTISGDEPALAELEKICEERGMFNRRLVIDTAYHSHHMNLVAKEYRASLLKLKAPVETTVRFHSSLQGKLISASELQASYWVDNLTCAVRFDEALQSMLEPVGEHRTGVNMLVELGPHSGMQGPIKQILKHVGGPAAKIPYASALLRKKDAVETAMDLAGTLFTRGLALDFEAVNFPKSRTAAKPPALLIDLPRYPWNYSNKYWQESRTTFKHKHRAGARSDILGVEAIYSSDLEPTWRNIVRLDDLPWLRHHRIQSLNVFPLSAFLVMALEASAQRAISQSRVVDSYELRDVSVVKPLIIPDEDIEMTISLRPHQDGGSLLPTSASEAAWNEFRISSYTHAKGWTEHCIGLIGTKTVEEKVNDVDGVRQAQTAAAAVRFAKLLVGDGSTAIDSSKMYDALSDLGVAFGPTFQGIENCRATETAASADLAVLDIAAEMPNHFVASPSLHPSFLESLIELYWPILGAGRTDVRNVYLPSSLERLTVSARAIELSHGTGNLLSAYCTTQDLALAVASEKSARVTLHATADRDSTEPLITLENLTIAPMIDGSSGLDSGAHGPRELCYKLDWEPILDSLSNGHGGDGAGFPDAEVVIVHEESNSQTLIAMGLATALEQATGRMPELGSLHNVNVANKICVVLSELQRPLLSTLTETEFASLKTLLTTAEGCLWVVRGAYSGSSNPDANMVLGLSRAIRSETAMKFATLDLDASNALSEGDASNAIVRVFEAAFGANASNTSELEFSERRGSFFTPRIINDEAMNEYVHRQTHPDIIEPTAFGAEGRSLKLSLGHSGALDTVHFVDDATAGAALAADEIEIEVKAIGVNAHDIAVASKGQTDAMGYEASGTVKAIGSSVTNVRVGDRVAALTPTSGSFSTVARTTAALAFKLPASVSFEAGASLPLAFVTAYHSLVELGRLADGESILVHAASGAIGQAGICLAQMVGAEVFATVSSAEKKALLVAEYNIPEDHIFYSRDTSFGRAVRHATNGQGVDVVLNALTSSNAAKESWATLNKFGRFLDIAPRDTSGHGASSSRRLLEMGQTDGSNASYISVDIFALAAERPKIVRRLIADVGSLLTYGKIRPAAPITAFSVSDVESALKAVHPSNNNRAAGKLVVVPHADDIVRATAAQNQLADLLRPDATYVLVGGTGGLGRSMARWMAGKGAKHIVLVSRTGSATGEVKTLIDELADQSGTQVVVRQCNVVDRQSVDELLSSGLAGLPPVRGIVHGTMVLRDILFEKMSFEDYDQVVEGKVRGGWNFHRALEHTPLDFFVAISSAAGAVGNRGQAAYAAANCFLNALVQHRRAAGLPASSLDLTMVSDSGYLANNAEKLAEVARNLGSDSICEAEVLALLGAAISGRLDETCDGHTITGMRITPSMQPFWTEDAKFKHLRLAMEELAAAEAAANGGSGAAVVSFNALLKAAQSQAEAEEAVCAGLVDKIAAVLMLEAEDMDVTRSLSHYPLDSLVAIEIRNFITREFEANMQVLELLSSGSIQTLSKAVCAKSKLVSFS